MSAPLTLLAAIYLSDGHFAVMSDRRVSQPDRGFGRSNYQDKWGRVEGVPGLLYGWAGSVVVGQPLARHVREGASNWGALKTAVSDGIKRLHERANPDQFTDCLIAGWLGDVPGILHVEHTGRTPGWDSDRPQTEEKFVGAGQWGADVAWKYAIQYVHAERTASNFSNLVRLIIDEDAIFGGFERWDIPPHGEPVPVEREDGPEAYLRHPPLG